MGVDVFLVRPRNKRDENDSSYVIVEPDEVPERLKRYITKDVVKYFRVDLVLREKGYDPSNVCSVTYGDSVLVEFDDGSSIVIGWYEIPMVDTEEYHIYVDKLDSVSLSYVSEELWNDEFISNNTEDYERLRKKFYWTPDEMNVTDVIFSKKGLKKWDKIKRKFKELYKKGEPVFVFVSW